MVEAPAGDTPPGLRDRAILELLYGSGLRVSELCGLDLEALDLAGRDRSGRWGREARSGSSRWEGACVDALQRWLAVSASHGFTRGAGRRTRAPCS